MKRENILIVIAIILVVAIGAAFGFSIVSKLRNDEAERRSVESSQNEVSSDKQEGNLSDSASEAGQGLNTGNQGSTSDTGSNSRAAGQNKTVAPQHIIDQIARDYPDYYIESIEVGNDDGPVFYDIDLNHVDPVNDSEYELVYDADWNLVKFEFDD